MTHQPNIDTLDEFLISARSLAEYRAIFALADVDLDGHILGPGGAASFTAEASELGATVSAADPIYAHPRSSCMPSPGRKPIAETFGQLRIRTATAGTSMAIHNSADEYARPPRLASAPI
ncbi:hypothetical protein ACWEO2_17180 [Nocardia sp. NPDC004278]